MILSACCNTKQEKRCRGEPYEKLSRSEIWVTNGAFGSLYMAMTAFTNPGQVILTVIPHYFGYEIMISGLDCTSHGLALSPDDDIDLNVTAIQETLLHHANAENMRILLLCNPSNPSGQMHTDEKLQELARALQHVNQQRAAKQPSPLPRPLFSFAMKPIIALFSHRPKKNCITGQFL